MTLKKCLIETVKMWRWLEENITEDCYITYLKKAYLNTFSIDEIDNDCFCCEYIATNYDGGCIHCPLRGLWTNNDSSADYRLACVYNYNSPYRKIIYSTTKEERSAQCKLIADYAQAELDKLITHENPKA